MRPLRIAIGESDPAVCKLVREVAEEAGHTIVCETESGRSLVEQCCKEAVELVIAEIHLEELDGIDAAVELSKLSPTAFILSATEADEECVRRATGDHVMSFLVKPIKKADLEVSIPLARARFEQFRLLHHEHYNAQTALHDRELIDRAKGILMRQLNLAERDAYRRLQELSWTKNLRMAKLAEMIITASEAMG